MEFRVFIGQFQVAPIIQPSNLKPKARRLQPEHPESDHSWVLPPCFNPLKTNNTRTGFRCFEMVRG